MVYLYIESVIIKRQHRRNAMFCLVRMLRTMVLNFCDPKAARHAYAMAATKDGEKTLRGMGFTMLRRKKRWMATRCINVNSKSL